MHAHIFCSQNIGLHLLSWLTKSEREEIDLVRERTDSKKSYSSTSNQATTGLVTTDYATTEQVASKHKIQRKVTKSTIKTRKEKTSKPVSKNLKPSVEVAKKGFAGAN